MNPTANPIADIFAALQPLHSQLPPKTYLSFTINSHGNCGVSIDVTRPDGGGDCHGSIIEPTDSPAAMQLIFTNLIKKAHACHKAYQTQSSSSSPRSVSPDCSPSSACGSAPALS